MFPALVFSSLLLAAGDPCAAPRGDACTPRNGHCFDLEIDGQRVEPLNDAALRAKLGELVAGQAVCWRLPQATAGTVEPVAFANARGASLGGLRDDMEMVVTPLEGQTIPTRKGIRTDPTVMIGGVPMQTVVDVIDTEALPDGTYVVSVRVRGQRGWDRKSVLLEVRRAGD
jgi:hypothetical protein